MAIENWLPKASRRNYVALSLEMLLTLVVFAGTATWIWSGARDNAAIAARFVEEDERDIFRVGQMASEVIEQGFHISNRLAANDEFAAPNDLALDELRSTNLSSRDLTLLANFYQARTYLATPSGPETKLPKLPATNPPQLKAWQVARGLPIRMQRRKLANSRRTIASGVLAQGPDLISIAEIDSVGGLVYLVPFELQLKLPSSQIASIIPSVVEVTQKAQYVAIPHSTFLPGIDGPFVTFVSKIRSRDAFLVLTTRLDEKAIQSIGTFWLLDSEHHLILHAGGTVPSTESGEKTLARKIVVNEATYTLVLPRSIRELPISIARRLLLAGAVFLVALLITNKELARVFRHFDNSQSKLWNAKTLIDERAQWLAHDFRNIAVALRLIADNTRDDMDAVDIQRLDGLIDDLDKNSQHLSLRLTAEALGYSSRQVSPTSTYLRAAIDNTSKQQTRKFKGKVLINFVRSSDDREPFVKIPSPDLNRALTNLIKNAVDACSGVEEPRISIDVSTGDEKVIVQVHDNGCGIRPDDRDRIFDDGFSTKAGVDRGNGLPSARERARSFGGDVRLVQSIPGDGTTFELSLPLGSTPEWFIDSITLTEKSVLVVVDDEDGPFQYWKKAIGKRIGTITISGADGPRIIHVRSPTELKKSEALAIGTDFLVDQHFKNDSQTGLQLIDELKLHNKAILVTNLFEQSAVTEEALRLGIRILPKPYLLNARFAIRLGEPV